MKQQTVDVQVGGFRTEETTERVVLLIKNQFIPAEDHIKIVINQEGIILERWDEANCRYVNSYGLTFSTDFNGDKNDVYADEPEDEEEPLVTEAKADEDEAEAA